MVREIGFRELSADQLRWRCDPQKLGFESTQEIQACEDIIGQPRAIEAIRTGLEIDGFGYNIFVTGLVGTGRSSAVKRLLREIDTIDRTPEDLCYVNNFRNPDEPRVLALPAGQGRRLKRDMEDFIEGLRRKVPSIFENETHPKKRNKALSLLAREAVSGVRKGYEDARIRGYLDEVERAVMEHLDRFRLKGDQPADETDPNRSIPSDTFLEFRVNVVVDNSETRGAPILVESFPTYRNLFGMLERVVDSSGVWKTDFTRIKPGSLIQANGGYLVLNAVDVLAETRVWRTLKRGLKNRRIAIHIDDPPSLAGAPALKPEPIDLNVKVIMIGDNRLYHLLYGLDEDFKKIFKVRADFDSVMDRTDESVAQYASFVSKIGRDENLRPFHQTGVAAIVEYAVRLAGKRGKISTQFHVIADVLREANYWAQKAGSEMVRQEHVDLAIEKRIYRINMVDEKIREMIRDGTIMIDSEGQVIGQVNGLATYQVGDQQFAKPARITAKTAMGRTGIINIEREADLSGKTHNKGVLILAGYVRGKYAQDKPLTMSASICFEQSYTGIDGDSASSTEVYAILSSLSKLPLRQDLAVTGSVNQKGEVQPIGGVNEKIEGFFDVCRIKGFTRRQGVIIPEQNAGDLMLRKDVVEAVDAGEFHIYPVRTIDEGIAILTGVEAGEPLPDGGYPPGSVNEIVDDRLSDLAEKMRDFGRPRPAKKEKVGGEEKGEDQGRRGH